MKHKNRQQATVTVESLRQQILELLTQSAPDQLKTNEISKELGIKATAQEYDLVREALAELEDEGLIFRGPRRRYGRRVPEVVVDGRLENAKRGNWLVVPPSGRDDAIEIGSRGLWTAFHGDIVRAKLVSAMVPGERPEGEITRVLERKVESIVGTLKHGRQYFVESDDKRIHRTITIRRNRLNGAKIGDKVVVKLFDWIDPYEDPEGTITGVLGRAGEMKAEIASIAAAHRLPHIFPDDVLAEAATFSDRFTDEDLRGRRDLRDEIIFTIDPYDARDFDDAISIVRHDDGDVTLGVHIADVSHYVREGSALDDEAYRRGTSVYLVTGVIPMLPESLSNNLCSLRPDEDRLAYSVFARLSPRGAIREYEITKSIIRSKRRFTYEEALQVLETGEGDYAEELLAVNKIAHVLRANRRRKGSVDFDTTELKFVLDENERPVEVVQKRRTESTQLIEDCMLLANRIVAEHIGKNMKGGKRGGEIAPYIYRIHDAPPKDKLLELSTFVKSLGYALPVDNVQPKDIQKLIDSARGTEEEELINEVTLRSMAKAVYAEFNIGHFGLAFPFYTHFTSPIRRYPDLIVHRMLFEYQQGMPVARQHEYRQVVGPISTHCSERERAAVEAERESVKIAQVEFLKGHVGDVFEAVISGIMPFGMFAELKRFGIEGLVRIRTITDDFYTYDERAKAFKGRRSRKVYRLGDPIHVRVIRVDELASEIDLELIDEEEFNAESGESREMGGEEMAAPRAPRLPGGRKGSRAGRSEPVGHPGGEEGAPEEPRSSGGRGSSRQASHAGGRSSRSGGGAPRGKRKKGGGGEVKRGKRKR